MTKSIAIKPKELVMAGKDLDNAIVVRAHGLVRDLLKLPRVVREVVRPVRTEHYTNIGFFNKDEEKELVEYLYKMREQYPDIEFEVILKV